MDHLDLSTLLIQSTAGSLMFRQIGAGEIILVLAVLLLLFGAKKLPELARSLGRSAKELKEGLREGEQDEAGQEVVESTEN